MNTTASHPANKKIVCVLGMHRSGTSCLVGSLQQAGLHLGKHHTWNKYNRKGNRENQDIIDLNDRVLAHCDGSWKNPPSKLRYTNDHLNEAKAIIEGFPADFDWGFKDPRVLLTLPLWQQALGERYQRVGIFRHPLAVSNSLGFREGPNMMPEKEGLALWAAYNKRLLAEFKRDPFPILCFDWEEEIFHQKLREVHSYLNLPVLDDDARFYSSDLKNYASDDLSIIPWKYRKLYKKLRSIAV